MRVTSSWRGASIAFTAMLLVPIIMVAPSTAAAPEGPNIGFGMGMEDVDELSNAGASPKYGKYWVGPWIEKHGWDGVENALRKAKQEGVTPVIQFWYWGDDISPHCVENGCWDSYQGVHLTKSGWYSMAHQLADRIERIMGGQEVIVLVETEFNKGGIDSRDYAPTFDALLTDVMGVFDGVQGVTPAINFGNWGEERWDRFPKAIAASEFIGFQTMRGSTRDSEGDYLSAVDAIERASRNINERFGKPTFLTDLALSTYPSHPYEGHQRDQMQELFARLDTLANTGLQGIVYRSLEDNPKFNTANYYGEAERHWGLVRADGSWKPSFNVWIDGVQGAERSSTVESAPDTSSEESSDAAASTDAPASEATASSFDATFGTVKGNNWWVQTTVNSDQHVTDVSASVNGGDWISLYDHGWGHARSIYVADGSEVRFRAQASDGSTVESSAYAWSSRGPSGTASGPSGDFPVVFDTVKGNNWWVQATPVSDRGITGVDARVNGGGWISLYDHGWGHARSIYVADGSQVQFRAHAADGSTATSSTYTWSSGGPTGSSGGDDFTAVFTPANGNSWWVQTSVNANRDIADVQARVNGGTWINLHDHGWGHARSFHVPHGSDVEFRARATDGSVTVSKSFTWPQ